MKHYGMCFVSHFSETSLDDGFGRLIAITANSYSLWFRQQNKRSEKSIHIGS